MTEHLEVKDEMEQDHPAKRDGARRAEACGRPQCERHHRHGVEIGHHIAPAGHGGDIGRADLFERLDAAAADPSLVVEPVNFNEPTQIVIAGHNAAVERACELAKAAGAKRAMKLAVSAPFHSSLLKPASDRLRDYMENITFNAPQIDLVNNVDVAIETDPARIKDALVRQAASPVRWVETMQKMAASGVTQVIECAPSKVLVGMAKRIDANLAGDALVDQAALERVLASVDG